MWELHCLTGGRLVDADLNDEGPESGGVLSRHRTRAAAEKAVAAYRRDCPLGFAVAVRIRSGANVKWGEI